MIFLFVAVFLVCVAMSDAAQVLRACMILPTGPIRMYYGIRNPLNPPTFTFMNDTLLFADSLLGQTGSIFNKMAPYTQPRRLLITSRLVYDLNPNTTGIQMAPPSSCNTPFWGPSSMYDAVFVPPSQATAFVNLTRAYSTSGPPTALHLTFVHWPEAISSVTRVSVALGEILQMLPKVIQLPMPVPMNRSAVMRAEWQTDSNLFDVNDVIRTRFLADNAILWSRRIINNASSIVPAFAELQLPSFDTRVLRSNVERFDAPLNVARMPVNIGVPIDGFTLPLVSSSRINDLPGEYTEVQFGLAGSPGNQTMQFTPVNPSNVSVELVRFVASFPFIQVVVAPRMPPMAVSLEHCIPRTIATNVELTPHNVFFLKLSAVVGDTFAANATQYDYAFSVHLASANSSFICMRIARSYSAGSLDVSFTMVHTSDFTNSTLPPTTATTIGVGTTTTIGGNLTTTPISTTTETFVESTTSATEFTTTAPVVINGTTGTTEMITEGPGDTTTTVVTVNGTTAPTSQTTSSIPTNVTTTATTAVVVNGTTSFGATTSTTAVIAPTTPSSGGSQTSGASGTGTSTGTGSDGTASDSIASNSSAIDATTTAFVGSGDLQMDGSELSPATIGIIAGAGGGGLCVGILVAVVAVCLCRRRSSKPDDGSRAPVQDVEAGDATAATAAAGGVTTASADGGDVEMQSARAEKSSLRMSIYGASPVSTFEFSQYQNSTAGPYAAFPTEESQQTYSPPPAVAAAGAKDEHHTYAPAPMPRDDHHNYAPAPMPRDVHHTYTAAPARPASAIYSPPPVTSNEPMGQYGQFDTLEDGTYQQLEISKAEAD
jgi:hypothetical protein